jgi:hypothetical protein
MFFIVLKPGPARRVDLGLEPGQVEEKIREGKTRRDPVDPARPGCKLVDFCFFFCFLTKTTSF